MFDSQGNFLFHSQDWRNHKYIRKEGDKYIYPEDIKTPQQASRTSGGSGGTHSGYGSGGSHTDRKVVAPSAPNPARTSRIATRNINSASGGGGSTPRTSRVASRAGMPSNVGNQQKQNTSGSNPSRAGMPSNIKKTNILKGGRVAGELNNQAVLVTNRKFNKTGSAEISPTRLTTKAQSMVATREKAKGLAAANERKKEYATSNSSIAVSEKKKGETAAKNRVNKLRPGQVSSDTRNTLHKTANRNYEIDYGNGHTRGRGTDSYDDERGRGQAYTAREEMKKGTDVVKKKEEADQKRYDEAFKNVDNILAELTGKSRKYEADIAEAEAKKIAKQRQKDEKYLIDTPEDFKAERNAAKSRIEKKKNEEEKWKVAKDISEARYKNTLHYKATKAAENVKNATKKAAENAKKTAKKTAKAYDEMHEKQADALIKGKEKVKSLLKKKKKK